MQLCNKVHNSVLALAVLICLGGCRNQGASPAVGNQQAPNQVAPGAGNSATGATGGSAAAPQAGAGHVPGTTSGSSGAAGNTAAGNLAAGATDKPAAPAPTRRRVPVPSY